MPSCLIPTLPRIPTRTHSHGPYPGIPTKSLPFFLLMKSPCSPKPPQPRAKRPLLAPHLPLPRILALLLRLQCRHTPRHGGLTSKAGPVRETAEGLERRENLAFPPKHFSVIYQTAMGTEQSKICALWLILIQPTKILIYTTI